MNATLDPPSVASPAPASDGFDILDVCHRQTVLTLGKLAALVSRLGAAGADASARELATEILLHFSTTAREHHEDEERHVFPNLLTSGDPGLVAAVLRLQQDHHWLAEDWKMLAPPIEAVAWGHAGVDLDALREGAAVFIALAHEHIALEESVVYPRARAHRHPGDGNRMALEMTVRRRSRLEADTASAPPRPRPEPFMEASHKETRMTSITIRIIREEHAALAAMLRSILLLLEQHRRAATQPDFGSLRAMLFYVDEFPEQRHHRKESALLFPKLRARTPLSRHLLDKLDEDHAQGERMIRELEHALLGFEMLGEPRRAAFEVAAQRYVEFYLNHMAVEEREILPLAERVLTADDWAALDEAFIANRDPLAGHEAEPDYRALFTRIVSLVPAPIGLGPASPAAPPRAA